MHFYIITGLITVTVLWDHVQMAALPAKATINGNGRDEGEGVKDIYINNESPIETSSFLKDQISKPFSIDVQEVPIKADNSNDQNSGMEMRTNFKALERNHKEEEEDSDLISSSLLLKEASKENLSKHQKSKILTAEASKLYESGIKTNGSKDPVMEIHAKISRKQNSKESLDNDFKLLDKEDISKKPNSGPLSFQVLQLFRNSSKKSVSKDRNSKATSVKIIEIPEKPRIENDSEDQETKHNFKYLGNTMQNHNSNAYISKDVGKSCEGDVLEDQSSDKLRKFCNESPTPDRNSKMSFAKNSISRENFKNQYTSKDQNSKQILSQFSNTLEKSSNEQVAAFKIKLENLSPPKHFQLDIQEKSDFSNNESMDAQRNPDDESKTEKALQMGDKVVGDQRVVTPNVKNASSNIITEYQTSVARTEILGKASSNNPFVNTDPASPTSKIEVPTSTTSPFNGEETETTQRTQLTTETFSNNTNTEESLLTTISTTLAFEEITSTTPTATSWKRVLLQ